MEHPKFKKYHSNDMDSQNNWFQYCCDNQTPFISVMYRTKLADVHYDYISYDLDKDELLEPHDWEIHQNVLRIFCKHSTNKRSDVVFSGWHVIMIKDVTIEAAEKIAAELYDLINPIIEGGG